MATDADSGDDTVFSIADLTVFSIGDDTVFSIADLTVFSIGDDTVFSIADLTVFSIGDDTVFSIADDTSTTTGAYSLNISTATEDPPDEDPEDEPLSLIAEFDDFTLSDDQTHDLDMADHFSGSGLASLEVLKLNNTSIDSVEDLSALTSLEVPFGELVDLVVYSSVFDVGPWIPDAPRAARIGKWRSSQSSRIRRTKPLPPASMKWSAPETRCISQGCFALAKSPSA